jgi:hypothetical protein
MDYDVRSIIRSSAVGMLLATVLSACSQEGGRGAYPDRIAATAPRPVATATKDPETPLAPLQITSYGPREAYVGQPFNVQPNGVSALWIKLNRAVDPSSTQVMLAGEALVTTVSGDTVTAIVPLERISIRGKLTLAVVTIGPGVGSTKSNDVVLDVK